MIKWETNNIILITIKPTLIEINMIKKNMETHIASWIMSQTYQMEVIESHTHVFKQVYKQD